MHPACDGPAQEGINAAHQFFQTRAASTTEFLLSDVGKPFEPAFRGLRLASLIGHPNDVDMIQGMMRTMFSNFFK